MKKLIQIITSTGFKIVILLFIAILIIIWYLISLKKAGYISTWIGIFDFSKMKGQFPFITEFIMPILTATSIYLLYVNYKAVIITNNQVANYEKIKLTIDIYTKHFETLKDLYLKFDKEFSKSTNAYTEYWKIANRIQDENKNPISNANLLNYFHLLQGHIPQEIAEELVKKINVFSKIMSNPSVVDIKFAKELVSEEYIKIVKGVLPILIQKEKEINIFYSENEISFKNIYDLYMKFGGIYHIPISLDEMRIQLNPKEIKK